MGTDIHGYIEVKFSWEKVWQAAINLSWLYDVRDYDAFGCFFGVRNYARFRPLAPERGLPFDVSLEVKKFAEEFEESYHGATWISWSEIEQIDWEEEAESVDERIHKYQRNEEGALFYSGKATWSVEFAERVGYEQCLDDQEQEWDLGDIVYRREKMKRKEVKASWDLVFRVMESLASRYSVDQVRLVVWFDS